MFPGFNSINTSSDFIQTSNSKPRSETRQAKDKKSYTN